MRKWLVVLALALGVTVPAAGAALVAPAPISALATSGASIAYSSSWTSRSCEHAFLWRRPTKPRAFASGPCPAVSTGRGIAAVAVAGSRVVWLAYAGGNIREWSLFTATATRPQPRRLRFVARDVDLPSPIVLGSGGDVIPYAIGRTVLVLRADGSRAFTWTAPAPVRALAARGATVAAAVQGGTAFVLENGSPIRTVRFDGEADAVALAGDMLVLQRGRVLDLRAGDTSRTWTLPAHAQLQDADRSAALYAAAGRIHRLTFADGSDAAVAPGQAARFLAGAPLVASGRRIGFVNHG